MERLMQTPGRHCIRRLLACLLAELVTQIPLVVRPVGVSLSDQRFEREIGLRLKTT